MTQTSAGDTAATVSDAGVPRGIVAAFEFVGEVPRRSLDAVLASEQGLLNVRIDLLGDPALSSGPQPLAAQLSCLLEQLPAFDVPLVAVSYCTGAPLAQAVIEAWPCAAAAVLLDPATVERNAARYLLRELAHKMDPSLDPESIPELHGLSDAESFVRAKEYLSGVIAEIAGELPAPVAADFLRKQLAWFSFGLALSSFSSVVTRPARVFYSEGAARAEAWASAAIETLPLTQRQLFSAEVVRQAVCDAMAELAGPASEEQ